MEIKLIIPYQNDYRLLKPIQDYGCLFLTYLRITSRVMWIDYSPQIVNMIYRLALGLDYIDKECTVLQPDMLLKAAGCDLRGWIYDTTNIAYKPTKKEIAIGQYQKSSNTHFVEMHRDGGVAWDSVEGGSNTVRNGKLNRLIIVRFNHEI